jgi:hypothetical protein
MFREYRAEGRYGYIGIDEYHHDQEPVTLDDRGGSLSRTVMTGIKPQKLGREFAAALQVAYAAGREDALRAWARAQGEE